MATGSGFAGQFPPAWAEVYEDVARCPDELLLFFHHVPYTHRLHSGTTVIQHIYDTHADGVEEVTAMRERWLKLRGSVEESLWQRVSDRFRWQLVNAQEWRDQVNTYFLRKSGIADVKSRVYL
ncbi:glycosyl hydrolase family 67 [Kineococcus rhizosphaerae]|uniref:Glycosyl hydrolase family 67 n=1 Tax=Kineococcus rhizosphaerae TaxID=559628 RepID=A0A2T0QR84_9ACTN|nr:glycosyl hydrolase family 67 [Kineococcus rhizosphaerae]